jgi:serine/threonine protein kinase
VLTAVRLAETLARAIHEAHAQGIVHGNLKPGNVLLTTLANAHPAAPDSSELTDEIGRPLVARITDFQVHHWREPGRDSPMPGVPCYSAPEQDRGRDDAPAADVYALGAILYHLLTGKPPFEAVTRAEDWNQVRARVPVPPSALQKNAPAELDALCFACLDRDPARRPASALVLAESLDQVLKTYVTHFHCVRCDEALMSAKPLRVGEALMVCPRCGEQFRVEAAAARSSARAVTPAPHADRVPPPAPPPPDPAETRRYDRVPSSPAATPSPSFSRSPMPGAPLVAGYTILGELGRGASGVVYKARHEKLKRVVALKLVMTDPDASSQYLSRFQAEAESVARLHHSNVVQIFEVGEQEGRPYLALEFVTGGTLKKRLKGEPQPLRPAVQLVEMLARAVHAAHLRGIVHRDLKPANILLEPAILDDDHDDKGDHLEAAHYYGVPKVSDFGLCKRTDDDGDPVRYGDVVGTPLYMAPEQAKGETEDVGPAADIYSLGAILYEMITGRPPFLSRSVHEVLSKLATEAPVPAGRLRRRLPRSLEAICQRCLEKDPRKRYRTALGLAEDLQRFDKGQPIRALPPDPVARVWIWSLRNPIAASLLLSACVVLGVGQWKLRSLSNEIVAKTARASAEQQTATLQKMYKLYSKVISRVKQAGDAKLVLTHKYPETENSLPIPARFLIVLGEEMEPPEDANADGKEGHLFSGLRLYSRYPFRQRKNNPPAPKTFAADALKHYEDHPETKDEPYSRIDPNGPRLRYATAFLMEKSCLGCHNDKQKYEEDFRDKARTDWKEGDVRGVLVIDVPLAENYSETNNDILGTYLMLGGLAAGLMTFSFVGLTVANRYPR